MVIGGQGTIETGAFSRTVHKGDYFFLPACVEGMVLTATADLEVIECLPPREIPAG